MGILVHSGGRARTPASVATLPPVVGSVVAFAIATAVTVTATVTSAMATEGMFAVPRVPIYPGDKITAGVLEEKERTQKPSAQDALFATRDELVGKVARRTLLPGQGVVPSSVRVPDVVQSGKPVTLVFESGGLRITGRGLAMKAGATGEVVSVQTHDSGSVVRGTVQPDGTVLLGD